MEYLIRVKANHIPTRAHYSYTQPNIHFIAVQNINVKSHISNKEYNSGSNTNVARSFSGMTQITQH
jgi:hypothetical protein